MNTYDFEDQRQALAVLDRKQNATWFTKTTEPAFSKPVKKRFEEMTLDELKDELWQARQTLEIQSEQHKQMPEIGLIDHIHKTSYRITIIIRFIRKIDPDFEKPVDDRSLKNELTALKNTMRSKNEKIKELNAEKVSFLREISTLKKKIEAYQAREDQFEKFKSVFRHEFGTDKYLEILSKVNN